MPFDLIEEIKLVLKDQGFYPYIKVTSDLLPSPDKLGWLEGWLDGYALG